MRNSRCKSTHRHGSEETFRNVGDNDSNKEDDGVEPEVSEDERDYEERHTEEDGHSSDEMDEMSDLAGDRGLPRF